MQNNPLFSWQSFPLKDYPKKSVFLIAFLFVMSYAVYTYVVIPLAIPIFFYYLGLTLFLLELSPWFVPTSYEFFDYKFRVIYPFYKVEKRYDDFKAFYADKTGIMLTPYVRPSRMDRFRGQSLRFSRTKAEKEQLLTFLTTKIEKRF